MKFSSALKTVAATVVTSLLVVTANPAEADPVSSPYTETIEYIAEQSAAYVDAHHLLPTEEALRAKAVASDATIAGVSDNGNTLTLGKGRFVQRGENLAIVGESGTTLVTAPLQGLFGDKVMRLNVIVKDGGRSATFLPAESSFRPVPVSIMEARDGLIGDNTRLREFYNAWGKYLNRAEVQNFPAVIAGGVLGGVVGGASGWAIGFLAGALVASGMLLFTLVPVIGSLSRPLVWLTIVPVFLAVSALVGIPASAVGTAIGPFAGTMVIGLFYADATTRELALQALAAGLALIFLWWLPPSAGDGIAGAGSGVGRTSEDSGENDVIDTGKATN